MDKTRKKNIKRIISLVCILAVVILLAAMPLLAKQDTQTDGPTASILSGTVATGSIDTALIGGGTLTEEEAMTLEVPAEVKLTEFLVTNGDAVTEGTPIATVDRVTVMTAIAQVQETMEYLSEQIEKAGDTASTEKVTALAGGTVKLLYAQEGDAVRDVMLEHGALAVLSLDGLMAVDLEAESALPTGAAVTVTLSDGTQVTGKLVKNLAGALTVTVEDDDYAVGEAVTVTDENGSPIGAGELYIYSAWTATAYAGTVSDVKAQVGDTLAAGKTLMVLEDVGYSAAYRQLISQRQEYEELMLELFTMYQTQTLTAPCDGVVSGIDTDSAQLLSADGQGYFLSLLANAPNGNDETLYQNFLGQITAITEEGWALNLDPEALAIDDYTALEGIEPDAEAMTQAVLLTETGLPVYALSEGAWIQVETTQLQPGDFLLLAADADGGPVWCVLLQTEETEQPEDPTDPEIPGTSTDPGSSTMPGFSYPSMGSWGSMGSMTEQPSAFQLYGLDMAQIAAVTPQNTVTLEISVDELDITALQVGMEATVKIDALGGEKFTAVISDIGNTGANNGGSSKYTVELTMDRSENMLGGMNATATVTLATTADTLTLPADALVEQGNQTLVYTGYDEEKDTLLDPVPVRVGISDGETVEILEGLTAGQTYYYAYYDTLEVSFAPDFGQSSFFG